MLSASLIHFLDSTQVLIPAIMPNPPYDPLKDFAGIYTLCNTPTSIVVHASVPARNLAELIAYAKANPGKLSYGSAGAGTLTNLAGELFKQLIGAPDIVHIPYKGAAPGIADLASGHIPMITPNVGGPLIQEALTRPVLKHVGGNSNSKGSSRASQNRIVTSASRTDMAAQLCDRLTARACEPR